MTSKNQLPVPLEGPPLHPKNPEEYAAMIQATNWLGRVRADHREGASYATEADNHDDDQQFCEQFLWGQDFEVEPEVWEREINPEDPDLRGLLFL